MSEREDQLVLTAMVSLDGMEIPKSLEDSIDQHQRNLTRLAGSLLACGHDEQMVRNSVATIFNSYREELVKSIMKVQESSEHG